MASSSTQPTLLQSEAQCKSGWRARLGKEMSKLQGMTHTGLASADSTINRLEETSHQSGFTTLLGMLSKSKAAVQRARERIDDHHDSMQQRLEDGELEPSSLLEKAVGADEMACCRALMSLSVKARSSLQPYTSTHAYGRGLREHWKAQQQLKDMHAEAPQVDASHLGRWMQLSAAVYGRLINRGLFLFRSCPSDNFLEAAAEASGCKLLFDGTSTASGTHRPAFAVFSCEQEGTEPTVVVSVRGTSNIKEFITDLVCEPMALASDDDLSAVRADGHAVHVHEGMWHATRKLAKDLEEPLNDQEIVRDPCSSTWAQATAYRPLLGCCCGIAVVYSLPPAIWRTCVCNRLRCTSDTRLVFCSCSCRTGSHSGRGGKRLGAAPLHALSLRAGFSSCAPCPRAAQRSGRL
eukprot:TRINITY_DN14047_c0_g1_i2.p1 TRINITY_DN14047_c0_g1~~TRINITY_DN14047_c0_g1_i2.p1  ORF type:complete len:407 (+),score=64.42 TRINITY_DN14047_c0_g1_i2:59-1279(+)